MAIDDADHSTSHEHRMILIGTSVDNNILVVVHIEYEDENAIRIISARKATKREKNQYEEWP